MRPYRIAGVCVAVGVLVFYTVLWMARRLDVSFHLSLLFMGEGGSPYSFRALFLPRIVIFFTALVTAPLVALASGIRVLRRAGQFSLFEVFAAVLVLAIPIRIVGGDLQKFWLQAWRTYALFVYLGAVWFACAVYLVRNWRSTVGRTATTSHVRRPAGHGS